MDDRNGKKALLLVLLVVFVALGSFGLGATTMFVAGEAIFGSGGPTNRSSLGEEYDPFFSAIEAVESEFYYRPVDRQRMAYGAAKGLMESLGDDYSTFETPPEADIRQRELSGESFEGIGAYIEIRNGLPTILSPIPNTPAERAGLRPRDIILAVDGRDVTELPIDQVATLVRGPAGTTVRLTIQRGNDPPFDVEIVRAKIEVPVVTLQWLDGNIAHVEVTQFGETTAKELDKALQEVLDKKGAGLILDLRGNRGGYVPQALQMLGRFLPEGTIGFYESRKADGSDDRPQLVIADGPKLYDIPMVALVNGGSASASELVAGALQDYERATIIGEQTFGKGSEQHIIPLGDGSSIRITFAHWLTPNKRDINPRPTPTPDPDATPTALPTLTPTSQATLPAPDATATAGTQPLVPSREDRGITPDIVVPRTEQDYLEDRDPQIDRAAEFLRE